MFEPLENAMKDDTGNLDKIDESLKTYDLSDQVLEAAASVDGVRAMTVGYCATAANAWYCLPF
jgi:dienelactone hydrolase